MISRRSPLGLPHRGDAALQQLHEVGEAGAEQLAEGAELDDVEAALADLDLALLRSGVAIIDTPGVGDRHAQTERARFAMATADLVLFVLDARQILSQAEQELAAEWRSLGKPVVLVPAAGGL